MTLSYEEIWKDVRRAAPREDTHFHISRGALDILILGFRRNLRDTILGLIGQRAEDLRGRLAKKDYFDMNGDRLKFAIRQLEELSQAIEENKALSEIIPTFE